MPFSWEITVALIFFGVIVFLAEAMSAPRVGSAPGSVSPVLFPAMGFGTVFGIGAIQWLQPAFICSIGGG